MDEAIKLLQFQLILEKETTQTFTGLSTSETIYKCTTLGQHTKATKIKTDFKIPDKRYCLNGEKKSCVLIVPCCLDFGG